MEITRDAVLPVPVDEAWELISNPDELALWFGDVADLELRPGARGVVVDPDGGVRHLVVDDVVEGQRVGFTWWSDDDRTGASHVDIEITTVDTGALVRVTERPGLRASVAGGVARLAVGGGWTGRLADLELRALLREPVLV